MSFPLFDLAKDLAVARAGDNAPDPERTMKRRIAALLSIPAPVIAAGGRAGIPEWVVGGAGAGGLSMRTPASSVMDRGAITARLRVRQCRMRRSPHRGC